MDIKYQCAKFSRSQGLDGEAGGTLKMLLLQQYHEKSGEERYGHQYCQGILCIRQK